MSEPLRICVKIGGALLETAEGRARLAASILAVREDDHEVIVVHGGGKQIAALAERLGLEEQRHEGLRITDEPTAQVARWVLCGEVNAELVHALVLGGVRAVGLNGADLGLLRAERKQAAVDLGFVGELAPSGVDSSALEPLLDRGIVPVIATLAPERDATGTQPFLNVNADEAAGPIAAALEADRLLMLSDVPGVLGEDEELISRLEASEAQALIQAGTIRGGMIPKVRAALDAVAAGVPRVQILSGESPDPLSAALNGAGTAIQP